MAKSVSELHARVTASTGELRSELTKAERHTKKFEQGVVRAAKQISGALGVGLGIGGVARFGQHVLRMGAQIEQASRKAQLSIEGFQTLSIAARRNGASVEDLTQGYSNLQRTLEAAAGGSAAIESEFAKLGLSSAGLRSLAPEETLEAIGRAINRAENRTEALGTAMAILGKDVAPALQRTLEQLGTEGFGKLSNATEAMRLSESDLASLKRGAELWENIKQSFSIIAAKGIVWASEMSKPGGPLDPDPAKALQKQIELDSAIYGPNSEQVRVAQAELARLPYTVTAPSPHIMQALNNGPSPLDAAMRAAEEADRAAKASAAAFETHAASIQAAADAVGWTLKEQSDQRNADLEQYGRLLVDIQTPLERYVDELERLADLEARLGEAGIRNTEAFDRAVGQAGERFSADLGPVEDRTSRLSAAIEDTASLNSQVAQLSRSMDVMFAGLANRSAQAFGDMVTQGELSFKGLADVVAKSIADMAAQLFLIAPLMNFAFGGISGYQAQGAAFSLGNLGSVFGGGKASGGPVSAGMTYLVGEQGPELLRMGSSPGMVIPNRALQQGGGGGNVYNIDARGADAAGLARLEQQIIALNGSIEHRSVAAVHDAQRRRRMR